MFIKPDVGREIKPASPRRRGLVIARILWVLALLAIGLLIGLIVADRLIVQQKMIYGDSRMVQVSVLLDLLDDLYPYLLSSMAAVSFLLLAALVATIVSHSESRWVRATAIAVLAILVFFSSVWWFGGRRGNVTAAPPIEATPTAVAP